MIFHLNLLFAVLYYETQIHLNTLHIIYSEVSTTHFYRLDESFIQFSLGKLHENTFSKHLKTFIDY